jgi:hypothetical protein
MSRMSRTREGSLNGGLRSPAVLGWLRLMRVYQKIDRASAENVRMWGISVAQFDVLAHVGALEGMTQQELANSLLVTKGNVCQLVGKLEDRGLISRRQYQSSLSDVRGTAMVRGGRPGSGGDDLRAVLRSLRRGADPAARAVAKARQGVRSRSRLSGRE